MLKKLLLSSLLSLCLISPAKAEFIQFICNSEEAVNQIAYAISSDPLNDTSGAPIAQPYIDNGTCLYLPVPVEIVISYHGQKSGTDGVGPGVIEVVGFEDSLHQKRFYGIEPILEQEKSKQRRLQESI